MIQHLQNNSNMPVKFRSWILNQDSMDEDDFTWLRGLKIGVNIDRPKRSVDTANGRTYFYGKMTIRLETQTDKQRDMLVLKYGNKVSLILEEIVMPGSISTCVLDRINW